MTRQNRNRVINVGIFFLPILLVKAAALLIGGTPGSVGAAAPPTNAGSVKIPTVEMPTWSPEQLAAARHVSALRLEPFGPSPLLHGPPSKVADPVVEPRNNPPPPKREVPPPSVSVQMILVRSDGDNIALIDRKSYRVGDPLGDRGWVVTAIDGVSRSVTIFHAESGREHTLLVPLPR